MIPASAKSIAAAIALAVCWAGERAAPGTRAGRADVRHDLRNLGLGALNVGLGLVLAAFVLPSPRGTGGLVGALGLVGTEATVVALVLFDLWMYAWHRANHRVPFLWRFHRVHHSDPALDSTSAVRFHPGEAVLSAVARVPVAWALGMTVAHLALYEAILLPVIIFHHGNIRLPAGIDRMARILVVTPRLHRVHHSPLRPETDSNYGSVLTVWDRVARSFQPPTSNEPRFGLDGLTAPSWQSLGGLLTTPFRHHGDAG